MAEAWSQIPERLGTTRAVPKQATSLPPDAQGSVRFAHRTLSLRGTLPEVPIWNKQKANRACEEAVEFVSFLWK